MGGDPTNENKMDNDTLCHFGILGMKWGVRRSPEQLGHKKKSVKDMTDDELRAHINRKKLESEYLSYYSEEKKSLGERFIQPLAKTFASDILKPSVCNVGKQYLNSVLARGVNKVNNWDDNSPYRIYTNNRKKD